MENIKPIVSFDEFAKMDLRVGTVISADDLENSNKLVKLMVDFGEKGKRQIIAGIKKQYKVEDLVGKQIVFIVNLEPRKFGTTVAGGERESQGMLLAAHGPSGEAIILMPEKSAPEGSVIS